MRPHFKYRIAPSLLRQAVATFGSGETQTFKDCTYSELSDGKPWH